MLKKTMLAILTIIALSATFAPMANAQRQCSLADREFYSAYADFRGC